MVGSVRPICLNCATQVQSSQALKQPKTFNSDNFSTLNAQESSRARTNIHKQGVPLEIAPSFIIGLGRAIYSLIGGNS